MEQRIAAAVGVDLEQRAVAVRAATLRHAINCAVTALDQRHGIIAIVAAEIEVMDETVA